MLNWIDWDALFPAFVLAIIMTPVILAPAVFIRAIVRWFNRRDDPRHAKRPPDPP